MPFTPLHLGPGLALKALGGRHFSFLTFGLAQVAMDIEPLLGLMTGAERLHGPTHTYLAALGIALAVAVITPLLGRPILRRWNREVEWVRLPWLIVPEDFSRLPVLMGAFLGTLSHVWLDSLMHADLTPLAPWSEVNGWLAAVSGESLRVGCLVAGLVGLIAWTVRAWHRGRRQSSASGRVRCRNAWSAVEDRDDRQSRVSTSRRIVQ
ncbi:DUF4184 family protein [Thiorhodococcus mannitoliphagus]|uniref:DUF4184 family protein n=1 Tax=Thiorhodococcus mannitoliphagus TaxID=329406 RepID=A0A6P1DS03_9GAMM|nr:DUF4184 family protein [Thiorhodococcus mannitoliphagus]NEX19953.1 DUF4184 family protein [Thiorhodococcus mannitoliphagus]